MVGARRNWTESEIAQAVELYVRTPFGRIHHTNPEIVALGHELGRTPGSIAMKMANIASLDETLDRKGMANASARDRLIWGRFFDSMQHQSMHFAEDTPNAVNIGFGERDQEPILPPPGSGGEVVRLQTARQGQDFFRRMILASYDNRCAITGIPHSELLVAGHIRPWAEDPTNRMNPRNGICLNKLHDAAFEQGLIAIQDDGQILYSKSLSSDTQAKMLGMNDTGRFAFPKKFKPDPDFLAEHRYRFGFAG